jgi:hypothetical protein
MRLASILLATLIVPATLALAQGQPYPYDPYPWCAVYGGRGGGGTNCGFRTWQQCMATVSGIGGFCEPNQFYNPRGAAERPRKRQSRQPD